MASIMTADEIKSITGAGTRARQIAVLKRERIPFTIRADGWPVTTWEAYNQALSGKPQLRPELPAEAPGFNLSAI